MGTGNANNELQIEIEQALKVVCFLMEKAFVNNRVKQKKEEIPISEISKLYDTIEYEVLCGFNERIPRIYLYDESSSQ